MGGKTRGFLEWGVLPVKKVVKCNLLEDDGEEVKIGKDDKGVEVEIRAFEVATFRMCL